MLIMSISDRSICRHLRALRTMGGMGRALAKALWEDVFNASACVCVQINHRKDWFIIYTLYTYVVNMYIYILLPDILIWNIMNFCVETMPNHLVLLLIHLMLWKDQCRLDFFFTTTTDTENISHHISTQIAKLRPMTFTTFGSTSSIWFFAYLAIAVKKRRGGNERVGHLQQN